MSYKLSKHFYIRLDNTEVFFSLVVLQRYNMKLQASM